MSDLLANSTGDSASDSSDSSGADLLPVAMPGAVVRVRPAAPVGGGDIAGLSVAEVVERLRAGAMSAEDLTAAVRVQCVGHLTLEGFTTEETAKLLGVNERTVRRDRLILREQEAIEPGADLTAEMVGEYQRLTRASIARLARLANAPDTPAKVKLEAEGMITRQHRALIDMAERFEYMPKTAESHRFQARRRDPAALARYREAMRLNREWEAAGMSPRERELMKLTRGRV